MIPLRTTQWMLTRFGLLQDENLSTGQKFVISLLSLINLVLAVFQIAASVAFAVEFMFIDLERTLMSMAQILSWTPLMYMLLVTLLLRGRITALIKEVTTIFNSIDDHDWKQFILEADNESEWIWKMYIKYGVGGYCIGGLVPGVSSIIWSLYRYGEIDTDHMYHQFEFTLPWNSRTSLGYLGEILISVSICEVYMVSAGIIILTFVALCLYHRAFYRIFEHSLQNLGERESDQKKMLFDLIRLHNTAKDLFSHSAGIWSHFILVILLTSTLGLACIVFQIDLGLKHLNNKILFLPLPFIALSFIIFVYCYYGLMATESYEKMAQCLFESNWPEMSIELQKYILLMIQNAQRPLYYHGFGIFILNLETHLKLKRTVFTYYMMMKTANS